MKLSCTTYYLFYCTATRPAHYLPSVSVSVYRVRTPSCESRVVFVAKNESPPLETLPQKRI